MGVTLNDRTSWTDYTRATILRWRKPMDLFPPNSQKPINYISHENDNEKYLLGLIPIRNGF